MSEENDANMSEENAADAPEESASNTPKHLWVVGVVSLLWNAVGAFDYFMSKTRNEA